jgi:outer membrane protein assembly factor BamE (lipoprotein component of BamABCDE complex)
MSHTNFRRFALPFCLLLVSVLALSASTTAAQAAGKEDEPAYKEYKGVRIGMTADEARKKLGDPTDKGDKQDFYAVSDDETVQVFYDAEKKVFALSVLYMGAGVASAPTAKAILGTDVEASADGRAHKVVQYPKAGYWVSYSRTGGDTPIVTITMQKK